MDHKSHPDPETIAAVATPPGRGGIGIVRLSGPDAQSIAAQLVRLRRPLEPSRATLADVLDPNPAPAAPDAAPAAPIDEAVVTAFITPHSYTGEDVVEIAAHGAPVVLETLLRGALAAGARLAHPGEFTQRAFLNHRLDLTQAEAVHDLIAAHTLEQARMAAQQLGGALSRRIAPIKDSLVTLIALLEAGMDFAAGELDDVDVVPPAQISSTLARIREPLEALARSYTAGHRLREGASLALVGQPNVGKSSLFNRLLERERAIVTPLPGTTRDTVEETTALGGIPLRLIDTAGLRSAADTSAGQSPAGQSPAGQTLDQAEALGIARSREALADADLVLLVLDASYDLSAQESSLLRSLAARPHLLVRNKADLLPPCGHTLFTDTAAPRRAVISTEPTEPMEPTEPTATLKSAISTAVSRSETQRTDLQFEPPLPSTPYPLPLTLYPLPPTPYPLPSTYPLPPTLFTSALTGQGLDDLRAAILHLLRAGGEAVTGGILNSLRQQEAVQAALAALTAAATANDNRIPHEFLLTDLHRALRALDTLTGQTTSDDILHRIFSTFCIGK